MFENNTLLINLIIFAAVLVVVWLLIHLNHFLFRKIQDKREGLHLIFFERINSAIILIVGVILAFSVFGGIGSIWKSLLGGTAIVSAVLAFAAQDVIKDILAGMMISLYKPFEIGNRIELEDGTTDIVKDITMRHVVLKGMDTQVIIIPNSKLNSMRVRNYSYHALTRGTQFDFHIGYGSDVEHAAEVIRQAIIDSPYSVPGKETDGGMDYASVYFMAYEDSSLRLSTTVYFESSSPSEVVISDINLRVGKALQENGIEIPYQYINIINRR